MTYLPTMGDAETIAFNSTKYPGVCKPMNEPTLQLVYALQNQLNRVAKMKGLKLVSVDGDVGPGTVALFNTALNTSATCLDIGGNIATFTAQVAVLAATLGAPDKVAAPIPSKAPTIITSAGVEIKAPPPIGASALDSIKNLGMPMLLALGAGIVGIGYVMTRKKKGHK